MARLSPKPILVTGMHRSGTTWVGRLLAASREAVYFHEPLSPARSEALLGLKIDQQYLYVTEENEEPYLAAYERLLSLPAAAARAERTQLDRARKGVRLLHGRLTRARSLLKDPFAIFSIPWFVRRLQADVVVVVRDPAAVVGSTKRLGWGFDTRFLLAQPRLMHDRLEHEREALEGPPTNVVEQAALLWRVVYGTAAAYADELPAVRLVRHEDLSVDPAGAFRRLYEQLGLRFSGRARRVVERATRAGNPSESPVDDPGAIRLDSRANLELSSGRLTAEEQERVERQTAEVARRFYS